MAECVHCNQPVPSTRKTCPHCGKDDPLAKQQVLLCSTCRGIVLAHHTECPHCAAPDPHDAGGPPRRMTRCSACQHNVSRLATRCPKCKAERHPDGDGAAPDKPVTRPHDPLRCPTCDAKLVSIEQRCLRCHPLALAKTSQTVAPSAGAASVDPFDVFPAERARLTGGSAVKAIVDPALLKRGAMTLPCVVCGQVVEVHRGPCPHCGTPDPLHVPDIEIKSTPMGQPVRVPMGLLITGVLVIAIVFGLFQLFGHASDDSGRKRRMWLAFGDKASDAAVAEMEQEAAALGVTTDAMIKVRFACLHADRRRPSTQALLAEAEQGTKDGHNRDEAVVAMAHRVCGR